MPILSKLTLVAAAAVIGGASAGSITSVAYTDAQCTVRDTECGADDVNLPENGNCDVADVTNKPAKTEQWVSGECARCPDGGDCGFPYFKMDDSMGQALAAQGVNPAYAKITCAGGVATIEHFSDAECTAANKVSNDELTAGLTAAMRGMLGDMQAGMADCLNLEVFQSGVDISDTHCDTILAMSWDEVRPRLSGTSSPRQMRRHCLNAVHVWRQACLTTLSTNQGLPAGPAAEQAAQLASSSDLLSTLELTVTGCSAPAPSDSSSSGRVAPATMLAFAMLLVNLAAN